VHDARARYDSSRAATILQATALDDAYEALAEITGTPVGNLKGLPDDFKPALPRAGAMELGRHRAGRKPR
jgi:outer membrane protein